MTTFPFPSPYYYHVNTYPVTVLAGSNSRPRNTSSFATMPTLHRLQEDANSSKNRMGCIHGNIRKLEHNRYDRRAAAALSVNAVHIAHLLSINNLGQAKVKFNTEGVIYIIFNSNTQVTSLQPMYIGSTEHSATYRYAQHQTKSRRRLSHHGLREAVQSWLIQTHPNDVCCVPLLEIPRRGPASFHTRSDPVERHLIHLFGTLTRCGGLNMVQPAHHLHIRGQLQVFCPLMFVTRYAENTPRPGPYTSRNYVRRITALVTALGPPPPPHADPATVALTQQRHLLVAHGLREFSNKHLFALYGVSRFIALPQLHQVTLAKAYMLIEAEVHRRNILHIGRHPKGELTLFTISILKSDVWDCLRVQQLLDQPELVALLPPIIQHIQTQVAFKHVRTVASRVQNQKDFFAGLTINQLEALALGPCPCPEFEHISHQGIPFCPVGHQGHVVTAAPHFASVFLPHRFGLHVEQFLLLGGKYRPREVTHMTPEHRDETLLSFSNTLDKHILVLRRKARCPLQQLIPFKTEVLRQFTDRLDTVRDDKQIAPDTALEFSHLTRQGFRHLGRHFLITYSDKATCNISITCKKWVATKLLQELNIVGVQGNPNYTPATGILSNPHNHVNFVSTYSEQFFNVHVTLPHLRIPYFACIPKFPKTPVGFRWLAIGHTCVLRLLQDRLTWLLKAIFPDIRNLWDAMQAPLPPDLRADLPSLESSAALIPLLSRFNNKRRAGVFASIFTHDVTNCYTNIPQDDLVARILGWLSKAWGLHPHTRFLKVSEDNGFTWLPDMLPQGTEFYCHSLRARVHVFELGTASCLIWLIVKHAYVQCGDRVFRQVNGIPMGASCSPRICDMYLLSYEFDFFQQLTRMYVDAIYLHTAQEVLRAFAFYRRFLDDCFTLTQIPLLCRSLMSNTQAFRGSDGGIVQGIYPTTFLPLNDTSLPDTSVGHFMDLEVEYSTEGGGVIQTRVYSKRAHNYFKGRLSLITVPSVHSNLYSGCQFGVVTSQFVRFSYLTTTVEPWLYACMDFCRRFLEAGYTEGKLLRQALNVIPRVSSNFGLTSNALWSIFKQEFDRTFPINGQGPARRFPPL